MGEDEDDKTQDQAEISAVGDFKRAGRQAMM